MFKYFFGIGFICFMILCCGQKQSNTVIPDMQPYFLKHLLAADSTVTLDSFRFIQFDTLHEKWALIHQRFPYMHDLDKTSFKLDSLIKLNKTDEVTNSSIQTLQEEKDLLNKEIDSINNLLAHADTIKPIGYFMRYKCSIKKKDGLIITDTIKFSMDTSMHVIEWDRNLDKAIDSLIAGRHVR